MLLCFLVCLWVFTMASPRPPVDASLAILLIRKLYPVVDEEDVQVLGEFPSYDDRNFHVKLRLNGAKRVMEYVFKIYHEKFSGDVPFLEACTELALRISGAGIPCPTPMISRTGRVLVTNSNSGEGNCSKSNDKKKEREKMDFVAVSPCAPC